jgi:glycosyltransferase involved in cell wall biosynthesis
MHPSARSAGPSASDPSQKVDPLDWSEGRALAPNGAVDFLPPSLRGRDMLCFSHDFSAGPLSKTHLMRLLARQGNRVLWVNSIGYRMPTVCRSDLRRAWRKIGAALTPLQEVEPNLFVLNPLVIPMHGRHFWGAINRRWLGFQVRRAMRKLNFGRPINWVFNPAAALVAGSFNEERVIYYCVDEYAAFTGVDSQRLAQLEQQLLARADLVIVSGQRLLQAKQPYNPRCVLIRHGVDARHFAVALDPRTSIPADIAHLPHPVLGYFGLIAKDWVDIRLMCKIARRFPTASIVMIGPAAMDLSPLKAFGNVHVLGHKPYAQLPAYCKGFDLGLIPFPINQATLHANPLKAREYLAAGLPVVSTDIPEVRYLEACRIGTDHDQILRQIEAALADPTPRAQRAQAMQSESWESRLTEIGCHLEAVQEAENALRLHDFLDWRSIWTASHAPIRRGA